MIHSRFASDQWPLPALLACLLTVGIQAQQSAYLQHGPDPSWEVQQPRGQTRTVDFVTEEGTWMSVHISPQSDWIVFDLLGHIYRVPSRGGEAENLTQDSGIALNFHPRYSWDGSRIAFISDRGGQNNLWVMDADGSNPRPVFLDPLTRLSCPVWTPDDTSIVAVREFPTYSLHRRSARIWMFPVEPAGSRDPEAIVGQPSGTQAYWPSLAASGETLYYQSNSFAEALHGRQRYQHIESIQLSTREMSSLTVAEGNRTYHSDGPTEMAPEASPDGRWLAFARRVPGGFLEYRGHRVRGRTALWLLDLKSGKQRILMDPITFDMQAAHGMKNLRVLPGYGWARDSESLVLSQGGKIRRVWLDGRVETIPFKARVLRTLSQQARSEHDISDGPFQPRHIRWPDLSHDGSTAVFEAVGWIWKQTLPDGRPEKLYEQDEETFQFMPEISPSGRQVAFVTWEDQTMGHLWVSPIAGGSARRLSEEPARYMYPTWSPDSRTLIVLRSSGVDERGLTGGALVRYDQLRVDVDSGAIDVIRTGVSARPSRFGPDGRLFSLEARGAGESGVQELLARGAPIPETYSLLTSIDPRTPARKEEHLRFPAAQEAVVSPDGRWVAYREDNDIWLAPLHRTNAVYHPETPLVWDGPTRPYPTIKEDPRSGIRRLSRGGGAYVRWIDNQTVLYASANSIHTCQVTSGRSQDFEVRMSVPRSVPQGSIALQGARIITLNKRQVIEQGTVVVEGSRIRCVGECGVSDVDYVLPLAGKTIVPGLVDVHAHHGLGETETAVVPRHLPSTALFLSYGVTTTLDPSTSSFSYFPVAELVRAGRITGPRMFATGEVIMPQAPETGPSSYEEAEQIVRRISSQGGTSVKIYLTPRRDQRQMVAEAARRLGLSVTNEGADLYYDVGAALDGDTGFEHPMHYLTMWDDAIQFFARSKTVYSPTLVVAGAGLWLEDYYQSRSDLWNDPKQRRFMPWRQLSRRINFARRPKSEYGFPFMAEAVADLIRAGGYASIGGHGEQRGLDSHWEIWGYAEALTAMEALEMASLGGAQMAGLEDDLGSIAVGKLADLVILDANPLEKITNTTAIDKVMKGGVLYDADTLNEVWPGSKPYGAPPWLQADVLRTDTRAIDHWDRQ